MANTDGAVLLEGFREFKRDLKRLEPEAEKALRKDIRLAAAKVAVAASAGAQSFARTGAYARSIRPYVTARGASVGSRLPQAGVLHWGGTIQPRGVPIVFPARPVISLALDRQTDQIVDDMGDAIEQAALRAGWHR